MKTKEEIRDRLVIGLIYGLIGLIIGLIYGLIGLIYGLVFGLVVYLYFKLNNEEGVDDVCINEKDITTSALKKQNKIIEKALKQAYEQGKADGIMYEAETDYGAKKQAKAEVLKELIETFELWSCSDNVDDERLRINSILKSRMKELVLDDEEDLKEKKELK